MRPVVTAVLLLAALMSAATSAPAWNPGELCRTRYPAAPCSKSVGEGWTEFGGNRCVKAFHGEPLFQGPAEDVCQSYPNGNLVSIHSEEELHQVECAMFRASPTIDQYYIGQRRGRDGMEWSDGTEDVYENWGWNQPDYHRWIENCAVMNHLREWNDVFCRYKKPYVCQVSL